MARIPCNLCGCDESRLLFRAKDLNYRVTDVEFCVERCCKCGLVYLNPQPQDLQQYYPKDYMPHQIAPFSSTFKHGVKTALQIFYSLPSDRKFGFMDRLGNVHKLIELRSKNDYFFHSILYRPDKKLLDIGCGRGKYLMSLKALGWNATQLYGIDYPNESLQYLKVSGGVNVIEGDFLKVDIPEGSFDVVTMKHSMEHFSDPSAVMAKIARILKPGGSVLIEIPNFKSIEAMVLFREKWHHLDAPRHLYHFTPKSLKILLNKYGFLVEILKLKKSSIPFVKSLEQFGYTVPKTVEKYLIRNVLKICKLFGYSGELQCKATKR